MTDFEVGYGPGGKRAGHGLRRHRWRPCPVEVTLAVIGGKWKAVLVFYMKRGGAHRFAELRRKTHGISERVLTRQLRELEADGIVRREVFAGSACARGVFADRIRRDRWAR